MSDFIRHDVEFPEAGKLKEWVTKQLTDDKTLLAFADDGVIWGKLVGKELVFAPGAPKLQEKTLQQAFVFGADCEVRLFRDELFTDKNPKWKTLRVADGTNPELVIKESQILWGDMVKNPPQDGFFFAEEYRAGIPGQWLPIDKAFGKDQCARLEVHHLVEYDRETGEARVVLSRLAGISVGERAMKVEVKNEHTQTF